MFSMAHQFQPAAPSPTILLWVFAVIAAVSVVAAILYWLLITTEGVYLGRRVVVWLYNITAHKYDKIKDFDDEAEDFFVARPLSFHLRDKPAARVLDVATGTGRVPHYLLNAPTFNGRVIGLDPAAKMLALAAAKLSPFGNRVSFVRQTADRLPFPDCSFDAVTCLESLEFFPSVEQAIQEMVRVLKPGGVLMVTRRRGWEAKAFLGRYRDREGFEQFLRGFGLLEVNTQPWQVDYAQVFGRKPDETIRSSY